MNKKMLKQATMGFIAFLLFIGAVYASYWVYSEIVTVTVTNYTISLTTTTDALWIHFSGNLLDPNGIGVVGATVVIYETDALGVIAGTVGTVTTITGGSYTYDWLAPTAGTYYFKAGYEVL